MALTTRSRPIAVVGATEKAVVMVTPGVAMLEVVAPVLASIMTMTSMVAMVAVELVLSLGLLVVPKEACARLSTSCGLILCTVWICRYRRWAMIPRH